MLGGLAGRTSFDCAPTLLDSQVADFCRDGFIVFDGVVSDSSINCRVSEYLADFSAEYPDHFHEPSELLNEPWFVEGVLLCPKVVGAVRSLLGADFGLPILISNHRVQTPQDAQPWHHDGDSHFGPQVECLQVMYYPQATPAELGPTEVVPGGHFMPIAEPANASGKQGTAIASAAGTVFITHYSLLHRRGASTWSGLTRDMLKYCYFRKQPPRKDWLPEPSVDLRLHNWGAHYYPGKMKGLGAAKFALEMYYWLMGRPFPRLTAGQGWPGNPGSRFIDVPYGAPDSHDLDTDTTVDTMVAPAVRHPVDNVFWGQPVAEGGEREQAQRLLQGEIASLRGELLELKVSMESALQQLRVKDAVTAASKL